VGLNLDQAKFCTTLGYTAPICARVVVYDGDGSREGGGGDSVWRRGDGEITDARGNWQKKEWRVRFRGRGLFGAMKASDKKQRRSY
jgi:hypothetical protein